MRAVLAALVIAATVAGTLAGCSAAPAGETATALTTTQAERLAVTRFRNFDAGVRSVTLEIPGTEAGDLRVTGWFDYEKGVGYGSVTAAAAPAGLVWWNATTIATRSIAIDTAPFPLPADDWQSGTLDPSSTSLANALALVASLGSDRPENPQLLAQSDAAYLRSDTVGPTVVDVFLGPSAADSSTAAPAAARARYWITDTGALERFESPASSSTKKRMTFDFGDASGITIPEKTPGE